MSTERLIEEAERLAASFRDPEKKRNLHLAQTLTDLVTALRAERERAEKAEEQARQQGVWAENIAAVAEQTNAVARDCIRERDAARAELARLTTPRPIAEAPRDGTWVLGLWWGRAIPVVVQWTEGSGWTDGEYDLKPTRFLPLRFEERSPPEGARDDG